MAWLSDYSRLFSNTNLDVNDSSVEMTGEILALLINEDLADPGVVPVFVGLRSTTDKIIIWHQPDITAAAANDQKSYFVILEPTTPFDPSSLIFSEHSTSSRALLVAKHSSPNANGGSSWSLVHYG